MKRRRKLWRKEVASNASQSRQVFLGELFQFHVFHWRCILILLQRSNVPVFFLSFFFVHPVPFVASEEGALYVCAIPYYPIILYLPLAVQVFRGNDGCCYFSVRAL